MDDISSGTGSAKRDLAIAIIAVLCLFALAAVFDVNEAWVAWSGAHEHWEIDEIPIALSLAGFGFAWFAFRRRRESSLEVRRRIEVNKLLAAEIAEREWAEQALREREARLRGVMDNVADGIVTIDETGVVESFNPAAERVFGYAASEVVGRNVSMLMPEPDRSRHHGYLRAYLDSGKGGIIGVGPREVTARRKDGTTFPMDLATSEMWVDRRRLFIGVARDITERKHADEALRESERRYHEIFDESPVAIWEEDWSLLKKMIDGLAARGIEDWRAYFADHRDELVKAYDLAKVIDVGRAMLEIFKAPDKATLIDANRGELASADQLDGFCETLVSFIAGEAHYEFEPRDWRLDGSEAVLRSRVALPPAHRHDWSRVLYAIEDITERRRAEEALRHKTKSMQLHHKIAVAANEATSVDEALQTCLDIVCAHMNWPVGHVYVLDDGNGGELVPSAIWHIVDRERFDAFRRHSEGMRFPPGVGLPGRVLADGAPKWIADVTRHPGFLRARIADEVGVKAGIAIPVMAGPSVVAVLEFFATEEIEPSSEVLEVMRHVGTQLGRVFERQDAEKTLYKSREMLRSVIDAVPAVINAKDTEGRYVFVNAYNAKLRGLRPQDAINQRVADVAGQEYAAWVRSGDQQVIATGEPIVNAEHVTGDGDGAPITWLTTKVPVRDASGAVATVVTVAFDITERKRAEEELRAAMETAEAANHAKGEFLAIVGHELRTPLNAILGFSEILSGQMFGPMDNEQYLGYARDIHSSGTHLLGVINDILEISRAEAGKLELDEGEVDTRAVIDAALRLVAARVEESGLTLTTDIADALPRFRGDEGKLKQILLNLLSNAIKFTPAPGTVRLKARREPDGRLVINVRDSGSGIAAEDIAKALAPFGQVDSKLERQFEGLGLGLPLAKSMAELHGGTLTLDSEPGVGTKVTVAFPARRVIDARTAAA